MSVFKRSPSRVTFRVHNVHFGPFVVMHRDRLARFATDLQEFIFRQEGTKLVVHHQGENIADSTKQLAEDHMAITTVFVAIITEKKK